MRSYRIRWPQSSDIPLYNEGNLDPRDTQGEYHMMTEAEIEVMLSQAKEHQGLLAATRS